MEPSHLPPSASRVLDELRQSAAMTSKELREATGLPRRTMYTALLMLRQVGLVQERPNLRDTRQTLFFTPDE